MGKQVIGRCVIKKMDCFREASFMNELKNELDFEYKVADESGTYKVYKDFTTLDSGN